MNNQQHTYQVVIIGGGAAGLLLGILLEKKDISFIVLEKRKQPQSGSRSLGIHPVSLELFDNLGFADAFVGAGINIFRGHAFSNRRKLGSLSFKKCPLPFNFMLSLPQYKTENLLEHELYGLNDERLIRGAEVKNLSMHNNHAEVQFTLQDSLHTINANYLVGCDGKDSFCRRHFGIPFTGSSYPDTYIMGDFEDNTQLGSDAGIFLCKEGLIESFPLINDRRRWVVKTDHYLHSVTHENIAQGVSERIHHSLSEIQNYMVSSFGVQKYRAQTMAKDRLLLAGDAAHVVSPIGGQGMNLGWLDVRDAADTLEKILQHNQPIQNSLNKYNNRRQKAAKNAIWRAEINMRLGRKRAWPQLRNGLVYGMLHTPVSKLLSRLFTMRGIERWPL